MARPEEAKAVKAFRAAKTGEEIVRSWAFQSPGRKVDALVDLMSFYSNDEKIGMKLMHYYAQDPLADIMDRGILDRRTRELIMVGMLLVMEDGIGVAAHVQNGLAGGCTKEEFMEVAAIACYEVGKRVVGQTCVNLGNAFKTADANGVTLYDYKKDNRKV